MFNFNASAPSFTPAAAFTHEAETRHPYAQPYYVEDMLYLMHEITKILDNNVADEELKILVLMDTEWGKEFVTSTFFGTKNSRAADRLSEVGISVLSLAAVRRYIEGKHSLSVGDLLVNVKTVQLRVLENAKFQHPGEGDRGEFLYMAPYLEFGKKYWVHKDRLQSEIQTAVHRLLRKAMPAVDHYKAKVICMAHASSNDNAQFAKAGVKLHNIFDVVKELDTQQLARNYSQDTLPGMSGLCRKLNIRVVAKHDGGNDTLYTMAMALAITLQLAKHKVLDTTLVVRGHPVLEVGKVVEALRNEHYDFTDKSLLDVKNHICEFCGMLDHMAVNCKRRCGCCLKQFAGHDYNTCPQRAAHVAEPATPRALKKKPSTELKYFLLPLMLTGEAKGFLHENNATAHEKQVALSDVARIFTKQVSQKEGKRLGKVHGDVDMLGHE